MNASCHLPSLIAEATEKLRDRCGDRAVFEARLLLGIATGSDEAIYPHMSVQPTEQQIAHYDTLITLGNQGIIAVSYTHLTLPTILLV